MKKQVVTLTNAQLIDCAGALNQLLEATPALGIMTGFPFSENARAMQPETAVIWKTRDKIIDQYTQKDEGGKPLVNGEQYVFASPEDEAAAKQEIDALNAIETELKLYKLTLEKFLVFGDQPHWIWPRLKPMIEMEEEDE